VELDAGFTCCLPGVVRVEHDAALFFHCSCGRHYLHGQLRDRNSDELVGVYKTDAQEHESMATEIAEVSDAILLACDGKSMELVVGSLLSVLSRELMGFCDTPEQACDRLDSLTTLVKKDVWRNWGRPCD
jgi:hypothetical protein